MSPVFDVAAATRQALAERLHGHTTSPGWLLEDVFPELNELRAEHHRLRGQVAADIAALHDLDAKYRRADAEHTEPLRQAHRADSPASAADRRTSRAARHRARRDRGAPVGGRSRLRRARRTRSSEMCREHEDKWLADLPSRLVAAEEKRRAAQRLLAEADADAYQLHKLGRWVQLTAAEEAFGRQPAVAGPVPANLSKHAVTGTLSRPWHKAKPWNAQTAGPAP